MNNEIEISEVDINFNIIVECANRILRFQADLSKAKTASEKEYLNFLIEEQKKLIEEYTKTPVDEILSSLNDLKSQTSNSSKESKFRNRQKFDISSSVSSKEGSKTSGAKPKER